MLYAIVGLLVVIADQWVKYWVSGAILPESTGVSFIPGILSLVNLHNDGAAFSFLAGSNARIPFIIITGVFIVAVIIALATKFISGRFARWCLVLVTAGGFSNCIDRVIYGYVQDMFKCELFNFPVFNVADIFITVFALLFVLAILFERKTVYDDFEDEFTEEDDEEEDYEEEEARPSRRAIKAQKREERRAAKAAKAAAEEEEEDAAPVRPVRKTRKERAEEEYAQAQAARQEAEAAASAPVRKPAAVQTGVQQPTPRPVARAQAAPAAASAQRTESAAKPAARPAAAPKAAAPVKKPAAIEEEFSLDDILAEFK